MFLDSIDRRLFKENCTVAIEVTWSGAEHIDTIVEYATRCRRRRRHGSSSWEAEVSGSISLSKSEPDIWIMAGWVFRLLIEPLLAEMDENDIDFAEVNQSYHLQTFPFELFEPVQARRIAGRLARVCGEVREEMLATPPEESRHRQNMQVADLLAELGPRLQEFAESDPPDAR